MIKKEIVEKLRELGYDENPLDAMSNFLKNHSDSTKAGRLVGCSDATIHYWRKKLNAFCKKKRVDDDKDVKIVTSVIPGLKVLGYDTSSCAEAMKTFLHDFMEVKKLSMSDCALRLDVSVETIAFWIRRLQDKPASEIVKSKKKKIEKEEKMTTKRKYKRKSKKKEQVKTVVTEIPGLEEAEEAGRILGKNVVEVANTLTTSFLKGVNSEIETALKEMEG